MNVCHRLPFVLGLTTSFVASMYIFHRLFDGRHNDDEPDTNWIKGNGDGRAKRNDASRTETTDALLDLLTTMLGMKWKDSKEEVAAMMKLSKQPLNRSVQMVLEKWAVGEIRKKANARGVATRDIDDSWSLVDKDSEDAELAPELLDIVQTICASVSSSLCRSDTPAEIFRTEAMPVVAKMICASRSDRTSFLKRLRDIINVKALFNRDHVLSSLTKRVRDALGNGELESALSLTLAGTVNVVSETKVNLSQIYVLRNGAYQLATESDCQPGSHVRVRHNLLISEHDNDAAHDVDAVVVSPPQVTSSFWSSTTTCVVRSLPTAPPTIMLGVDPKAAKARCTVTFSLPIMGSSKPAQIQCRDTWVDVFVDDASDCRDAVGILLDPTARSSDDGAVSVVVFLNGVSILARSTIRVVTEGMVAGKWDATYHLRSMKLTRGSIQIPLRVYLDEKTGLRARIGTQIVVRFRSCSGPDVLFAGPASEASSYAVLTGLISSNAPRFMRMVRSQVEEKVRSALGGRDVCLLPWASIPDKPPEFFRHVRS